MTIQLHVSGITLYYIAKLWSANFVVNMTESLGSCSGRETIDQTG
jgi:hypothetical protein